MLPGRSRITQSKMSIAGGPSLVLITGKDKPFQTVLSNADYAEVRSLGRGFLARTPRSVEQ